MRWTDDHCHLGHLDLTDDAGVVAALAAAAEQGVTRVIDVGTDVDDSTAAADRAAAHTAIWATAGVHPHEARHGLDGLEPLLARAEVRAVGECGLDYHYDHSPRELQREVFAAQVALAHAHARALVIHTREAWDDTFAVLDEEGVPERTVFHCFTGGAPEAERALTMGAHLSFSGIVTFPSADDVREAARLCPDDRLLVETDAPFLTPVPHRGRPNHPSLVPLVGARVAEVRGQAPELVAEHSWANATRVYDLPD
ncbi:MAG TPA: TatD family hydrolase [Acidimicrobiales bacterium]